VNDLALLICFGLTALIVTAAAVLLMVFYGWGPGAGRGRKLLGGLTAYALVVFALGGYAYAFVPAQYTRDLDLAWPPAAGSLGGIHTSELELLAEPGALAPTQAARLRDTIERERTEFMVRWLVLAVIGPVAGLAAARTVGPVVRRVRAAEAPARQPTRTVRVVSTAARRAA
jgi:hypothetical protein